MEGIAPPPDCLYTSYKEAYNALKSHGMQHGYGFLLQRSTFLKNKKPSNSAHPDKHPNPKFGPCNLALRLLKYLVYAASGGWVVEWGLIGLLIHNLDVSQGNQRVCRVAAATIY